MKIKKDDILIALAVSSVYFLLAKVSFLFVIDPTKVAVLWLPSGFTLAAFMLLEKRRWPLTLGATFISIVLVNLSLANTLAPSIAFALANCLEPILIAGLVRHFCKSTLTFGRPTDVVSFTMVAILLGNAITSLLAAVILALLTGTSILDLWPLWFIGNGISMLMITPLLVSFFYEYKSFFQKTIRRHLLEAGIFGAVLIAYVFLLYHSNHINQHPVLDPYAVLPLLIILALRSNFFLTALAVFCIGVITAFLTVNGIGYFAHGGPWTKHEICAIQVFFATTAITSHLLAAFIQERRQIEKNLQNNEAQIRAFVSAIPDLIFINGADGKFLAVYASDTTHLLVPKEALLNRYPAEILPPQLAQQFTNTIAKVLKQGVKEEFLYELPIQETIRHYEARVAPCTSDSVLTIIRDVTARKVAEQQNAKMQAQLLHSSKLAAIGTLAAGMAHEINNPLAIIKGIILILEKEIKIMGGNESMTNLLKKQDYAIERIANIVRGLRTFARQDGETCGILDINHVIQETMSFSQGLLTKGGTIIKLHLDQGPLMVRGNLGKLQQVVINLINNANDAYKDDHDDKVINVTTGKEKESDMVVLTVSDSGSGIDKEHLEKIFEPFFTARPAGTGTGLGLYIVHTIVSAMAGKVEAQSKLGLGTSFIVRLPQAK